jgi:hypothetical protein
LLLFSKLLLRQQNIQRVGESVQTLTLCFEKISGVTKPQSFSKQKKNRKSPGPGDFENSASSRAEDVQSPAYSDISDDSTPVVDSEIGKFFYSNICFTLSLNLFLCQQIKPN